MTEEEEKNSAAVQNYKLHALFRHANFVTLLIQRILPALLTSLPNLHTPQYVNKGKGRITISPFEGILSQVQRCQNNKRNVESSAMMSLWPHCELVGEGPSGKFCTFIFSFLDDLGGGGERETETERQRQ